MFMSSPPPTMRAWRLHHYGDPVDVLRLEKVPVPEPGTGEVLVRVQAIPLNLNDLDRTSGINMMVRPELPSSPGMEVFGVVERCGDGAEHLAGQRVAATTSGAHGGFAEYALCPAAGTFPVPASIPLPDAAALYFPFHLAWLGLVDRAALTAGQSVLVHAGAGGAGSAAIQLARHLGARVLATAGTAEKRALCTELGADVVIDYTSVDVAEAVLAATDGRGVDVVFDTVGEAVMEASLRATAYGGNYVMVGFASNKAVADEPFVVPRRVMLGNLHLSGVLLAYADPATESMLKSAMGWNFVPTATGASIMGAVVDLVEAGSLRAVVGEEVPFTELPPALARMASRHSTGRTVVSVP
jgi:NADPH2:quinone reductase